MLIIQSEDYLEFKDENKNQQNKIRKKKRLQESGKKNEIKLLKYTKNQKRVFFEPPLGVIYSQILKIMNQNRVKLIMSLLLARFFMYLPFSFVNKEYPMIKGQQFQQPNFFMILPKYLLSTETVECLFVSIFCGIFMDLYSVFSISQFSMAISILGIIIQGFSIISNEMEIFFIGYSFSFFVKLAYLVCFEKIVFDTAVSFKQASINSSLLNIIACLARIVSCIVSYFYNEQYTVQFIVLGFSILGIVSHLIPMRVMFDTIFKIEDQKLNCVEYQMYTKYKNYNLYPSEIKKIYFQRDYLYLIFLAVILLFPTSFKGSSYLRFLLKNYSTEICAMYTCFDKSQRFQKLNMSFGEFFLDAFHQVGGLIFCTPIVYYVSSKKNNIQMRYLTIFYTSVVILVVCIIQLVFYQLKDIYSGSQTFDIVLISVISTILGGSYYLIRVLIIQLHFAINPQRSSIKGIGIAMIATFTELQGSFFSFFSSSKEDSIFGLLTFFVFLMVFVILFQYNYLKGKAFDKVQRAVTLKYKILTK